MNNIYIFIFTFLLCANVHAFEIRYDGVDCTVTGNPPLQSRIIVTSQIENFYKVRVEGGLPSYDRLNSCMDIQFRVGGDGPALPRWDIPSSVEAYALYSAPFVYVFVDGVKSIYSKANFSTKNVFVFSENTDNSFVLLREEWLGSFKDVIQSGVTIYDQPGQEVKYSY